MHDEGLQSYRIAELSAEHLVCSPVTAARMLSRDSTNVYCRLQ